jgi:hypothetical protein
MNSSKIHLKQTKYFIEYRHNTICQQTDMKDSDKNHQFFFKNHIYKLLFALKDKNETKMKTVEIILKTYLKKTLYADHESVSVTVAIDSARRGVWAMGYYAFLSLVTYSGRKQPLSSKCLL